MELADLGVDHVDVRAVAWLVEVTGGTGLRRLIIRMRNWVRALLVVAKPDTRPGLQQRARQSAPGRAGGAACGCGPALVLLRHRLRLAVLS